MASNTENERWRRGLAQINLTDLLPAPSAAITDLTHSALTGTPDNTLADIATADAALEADLKDLAAKVNEILAALRTLGIISS